MTDEHSHDNEPADDSSPVSDMELAYLEALRSIDEAEMEVGSALMELADDVSENARSDDEAAFVSVGEKLAEDLEADSSAGPDSVTTENNGRRVSPSAVIEAALFVGGDVSLTARRLATLVGQDVDAGYAVQVIDLLNEKYAEEQRPYEIRLHEGGFRLELKESYSDVTARVFGLGPREVKLSPEALETLAYIAYNQPVTREDLEATNRRDATTIVRKLIRLRLVEMERTGSRRSDVSYGTGQRFLDLFGLNDLDELPQADVFSFK